MQMADRFRWLYSVSGFWLILSPFLLFGGQSSLSDEVLAETGILMAAGVAALVIAGFDYKRRDIPQSCAGFMVGLALAVSPWIAGYSDNVLATWNAGTIGFVLAIVGLCELYQHWVGHGG